MTEPTDLSPSAFLPLDEDACFERLGQTSLGRIVLSLDALPEMFPVQYALLGRDPVFRTIPGHKLTGAADGQVLCMGIDEFDAEARIGWRVLVTGPAQRLTTAADLTAAAALPLKPWVGETDGSVRISAALVRGTELRGSTAPSARGG